MRERLKKGKNPIQIVLDMYIYLSTLKRNKRTESVGFVGFKGEGVESRRVGVHNEVDELKGGTFVDVVAYIYIYIYTYIHINKYTANQSS